MDQHKQLSAGALVSLASICYLVHIIPIWKDRWIDFTFANGLLIFMAAETILATCWVILGPFSRFIRLTVGPSWLALIWISGYQLATKIPLFSEPAHALRTASLVLGIHFVVAGLLVWLAYRKFGWRARLTYFDEINQFSGARQFTLQHAFVILTAVSLLFAVARTSFPSALRSTFQVERFIWTVVLTLSAFGGLMGPLIGLTVLRPNWRSAWLIPLFVILTVSQTVALGLLNEEFTPALPLFEVAYILADNLAWNLLQMTPVFAIFLLVRLAGVRLVNVKRCQVPIWKTG